MKSNLLYISLIKIIQENDLLLISKLSKELFNLYLNKEQLHYLMFLNYIKLTLLSDYVSVSFFENNCTNDDAFHFFDYKYLEEDGFMSRTEKRIILIFNLEITNFDE